MKLPFSNFSEVVGTNKLMPFRSHVKLPFSNFGVVWTGISFNDILQYLQSDDTSPAV